MSTKKSMHLTFRMSEGLNDKLEIVAGQHRMTKSRVLRIIIAETTHEQLDVLLEAARKKE